MLEARELVGEAVPSSWSIQKPGLSERAKQHRAHSVRTVVCRVAAARWGLIKMGDGGINMSIYNVGGGVFNGSLSIMKDGILEVGGDARRHLHGENFDKGTLDVSEHEFKRKEPT